MTEPTAPGRRDGEDHAPRTFATGPSDPVSLADEPGTWAEIEIDAPPARVWEVVIDLNAPAAFSEEFLGARWIGDGPALGASFVGRNQHPALGEWEVESHIDVFDEGRSFGWATVDRANPGSRWRFDLVPSGAGTRLRFSVSIGPGPSGLSIAIEAMPDKQARILDRRIVEHHANMTRTLEGFKVTAEHAG